MIGQTEIVTPRGVTDFAKETNAKEERGFAFLCFTTVIGLDINFPQYPASDARGLIDYRQV